MKPKMSFKDMMDTAFATAIAAKLAPSDESLHRYFCRRYSELFNTKLSEVMLMDPIQVLLHVYEYQLDKEDTDEEIEKYLETLYHIEDPEYQSKEDEDLEDFMEQAVEQERERVRLGKPIHKDMKDEVTLIPNPPPTPQKQPPKAGYIDLSYLEKEEQ